MPRAIFVLNLELRRHDLTLINKKIHVVRSKKPWKQLC